MRAVLTFLSLEIRRAFLRLPRVYAGAAVLLVFLGTAALLTAESVRGGAVSGRVSVGVILPKDDSSAKQAVSMLASLPSVKSLCDFTYTDRETCLRGLSRGDFAAVLAVPEGFVEDILDGTNTPVTVLLGPDAGVEGKIFAALAAAGAKTLGASQAGIYAMDELLRIQNRETFIPQAEADLNRSFLEFSLSRLEDFETVRVRATGALTPAQFYGLSLTVLLLQLGMIPAAGYFARVPAQTRARLTQLGAGPAVRAAGRILGTALLMLCLLLPAAAAAAKSGQLAGRFSVTFSGTACSGAFAVFLLTALLLLTALAAASFVSAVFSLAGSPNVGVFLLFFLVTGLHFLAGGILPAVFLPSGVQKISGLLPPSLLTDGLRPLVTGNLSADCLLHPAVLFAVCFLCNLFAEVRA